MRVLFPHQNLVGPGQTGNSRGSRTIAALLEAGCEVNVVAADRTYLGVPVEGPRFAEEGGLSLHRVHLPPDATRGRSYSTFQAGVLARKLPKPDVVLATTPPLPGVSVALALAARWSVPLVLEVRDLWPAFLVEGGLLRNGAIIGSMQLLELTALSAAAGVISVSPGFVPYLRMLRKLEPLVAVSGLDPSFVRPPAAKRGAGFRIAYTGSLHEVYGVGLLAEVAEAGAGSGWSVVVAGAGRQAAAVQQAPGVEFHGPLPRAQVPALLHAAHAGINIHAPWPLLATTLTGKLFDYLAAGLPVLDAASGAMGAVVDHLGAGMRCRAGRAGVVEAARWLQHNPRDAERMGAAGAAALAGPLCADVQARRMAEAVIDWARNAEPLTSRRLLRSVAEAACGVMRGTPARALQEAYRGTPAEVAERATRSWLQGLEPLMPQPPLTIPRIL
jgi:glycosyltransferase involved in cell wall biosynthesis